MANSSRTTAVSSMNTESGWPGAGATRSTRTPSDSRSASYCACWSAAALRSIGSRARWVSSQSANVGGTALVNATYILFIVVPGLLPQTATRDSIRSNAVLIESAAGLFCPAGDFHVDPWGAASRAVITHAHGDHARLGSASYLCAEPCGPVLPRRFGPDVRIETLPYGERLRIGSVDLSFHPAGHVLGSAQIRIEGPGGGGGAPGG